MGSNVKPVIDYAGSNDIAGDFNDRAMEHDFDFDSAASSPSPNMDSRGFTFSGTRHITIPNQMSPRSPTNFVTPEQTSNVWYLDMFDLTPFVLENGIEAYMIVCAGTPRGFAFVTTTCLQFFDPKRKSFG